LNNSEYGSWDIHGPPRQAAHAINCRQPANCCFRKAEDSLLFLSHQLSIECFARRWFWGTVKGAFSEILSAPHFTKMVKSSIYAALFGLNQLAILSALRPPFLE
jgi:hypothetical protein